MASVDCGPGTAIDGVGVSWKATLDVNACVDRPPVPLDGGVDVHGLFDGSESCVEGGMGMSDEDPAASIPGGAVDTTSG